MSACYIPWMMSRRGPQALFLRHVFARTITCLTLVAFVVSGFLTQTHIHHLVGKGAAAAVDIFDTNPSPAHDGKLPTKNSDQNCPLCQQFAGAGSFVTPTAAAMLAPSLVVSVIAVATYATHDVTPITHTWRGRAPPRS